MEGNGWQKFAEEGGLVLGSGIAKELDVKAGDWVSLLIFNRMAKIKMAQPNRERVQVTAILRLDGQLDHSYAFTGIASSTRINGVSRKIKSPL